MNFKNMVKKSLVTYLAVTSLFVLTLTPVQASSKREQGSIELQKGELTMGDIVVRNMTEEELIKLESGEVEAIEFDTMEEFNEYLQQREAKNIDITNNINEPTFQTYGRSYALSDVSTQCIMVDPIPLPPVYINCQFSYTSIQSHGSLYVFTSISGIDSWLTGIQFPVNYSWVQKSGTATYTSSMRGVTITVSGVLSTHIIVKGIGHVLDQNMSYAFDYTARA